MWDVEGIAMSMDNAHMNEVHFEKSFFVWSLSWLSSLWNFVGIVCDSSLCFHGEKSGRIAFGLATINFAKLVVLQFIR